MKAKVNFNGQKEGEVCKECNTEIIDCGKSGLLCMCNGFDCVGVPHTFGMRNTQDFKPT
jgi:hypothetical protein